MPLTEYHTNLAALEAYGKQIADTFRDITCTMNRCPHCGKWAMKLAMPSSNDSYVDAVYEDGSRFYPARYCSKDIRNQYIVVDFTENKTHTPWASGTEVTKPEPGQHACNCAWETVLSKGCQCGGS
jgi:hypothetical protein